MPARSNEALYAFAVVPEASGWAFVYHGAMHDDGARRAVLLGASGLVGGFCLQTLLSDSTFARITLLGRRELKVRAGPRLTQQVVTLEELQPSAFAGIDDVFCALGTTIAKAGSKEAFRRVDVEYPLIAAKAARQAGARQFLLVSSVGANPASGNFYLHCKGELEEDLGKLGFAAVHIFRPSLLLGKREEFRLGERLGVVMAPALNAFLRGGLRKYRAIRAEVVGRAMPAAAKQGGQGVFVYHYDEIQRLAQQQLASRS